MRNIGACSLILLAACFFADCHLIPASAQGGPRIQKDALQKSIWHTAPREIQIIDDRPVIKDFREAPQAAGSIELPPAPPGFNGSSGGGGAGALGGGPGASIPGSGLAIPGNAPGYRAASSGLPKSGFGNSNIPARGMGPGHLLPGVNHGGLGRMNQARSASGPPRGVSVNPKPTAGYSSTPVATYNGSYGTGIGPSFGGSSTQTSTAVRGSLLKK